MADPSNPFPPSIRVTESDLNPSSGAHLLPSSPPGTSDELPIHARSVGPMSIPNARGESPPPPLPPPRYIEDLNDGQDTGWEYANAANSRDTEKAASVKPGSSLLGGGFLRSPKAQNEMSSAHGARDSIISNASGSSDPRDDGAEQARRESPDSQSTRDNNRLHGERHMGLRSLENSSHAYDKQLLSRIGGPRTPPRAGGTTSLSTSAENNEPTLGPTNSFKKLNGQLKPLSMPERIHGSVDSPRSRWPNSAGQASPSFAGMRSPPPDPSRDALQIQKVTSSSTLTGREDSASVTSRSHRGSYDHGMFEPEYEDNGMKDLHLHDGNSGEYEAAKAGMKRRANSPPGETSLDPRLGGSAPSEQWNRRPPQAQTMQDSPVTRFHNNNQGSYSSTSSFGAKNGSYPSSYGLSVPSSATSYGSERLSPIAVQMANEVEYQASKMAPSPRPQVIPHLRQDARPAHIRKLSGELVTHVRHTSSPRMQTLYICECCPKKPRKFESADELRNHEMEKQYICHYCHNRFKNKNEAERHQNSLHLRRHSWSCAALTTFEDAFHPHTTHPNLCDICGYCGEEFAKPANWDVRVEHLNHEHKFGECNHAKKFFRADHFRQHLKHSHAGKSGKWTNMLENACMKDEPPPQRHTDQLPGMATVAPMAPMGPIGAMRHLYTREIGQPAHYMRDMREMREEQ